MRNFVIGSRPQNIIRALKWRGMRWGLYVARVGKKACIQCFCWDHAGKTPLVSHGHRWEDISKMYHKSVKCEIVDWDDLADDGYMFLWTGQWSCGFHNMRGVSWLAEELLASQEWLCCMDSPLCFLIVSVVPSSKESSFHAPLITFHYT